MASSSEDSASSDLDSDLFYVADYVFENSDDAISDAGEASFDENVVGIEIESADSDENDDGAELGLAPFMFEPSCPSRDISSEEDEDEEDEDAVEQIAQDRAENILWCKCGHCRAMDSHEESVCCKEVEIIPEEYFEGLQCITKGDEFNVLCRKNSVLENALAMMGNMRGDAINRNPPNESFRFAGYRQYIWWVYKYLGRKNRRIIPSCVVWSIRDKYPNVDGGYVPFAEAILD